jgi:hypothetical protein
VRTCSTPWSPGRATTTGWRAAGRALATRRSPRRRTMG